MPLEITRELVSEFIEEDSTLWTLKRLELDEVMKVLGELHPDVGSEEELFEALLDVMYKTRPTGPI